MSSIATCKVRIAGFGGQGVILDITQVAKVLGNRGSEKPTGSTAGVDVTHRTWSNSDGSACDVMFRKGKVYKKMWSD